MPVIGTDTLIKNITTFGGGFKKHVKKVMVVVDNMLDKEITGNMTLTDHPQEVLDMLDHPYAGRHGPQGKPIHDPYWAVHKQSGKLLSSKKKGVTDVEITGGKVEVAAWVGLDESIAPHALHVIWGTSKMIPRDFLSRSLHTPDLQDRVSAHIESNLRDFVVHFQGLETK